MDGEGINPHYEVIQKASAFYIIGMELTNGDKVSVGCLTKEKAFAEELAALLNDKKVSVHHAKDVIRDRLVASMLD